jgi:hypothetical protein
VHPQFHPSPEAFPVLSSALDKGPPPWAPWPLRLSLFITPYHNCLLIYLTTQPHANQKGKEKVLVLLSEVSSGRATPSTLNQDLLTS